MFPKNFAARRAIPGLFDGLEYPAGDNAKANIAYCFLAIDREPDECSRRLFDEFFILRQYADRYLVRKGLKSDEESLPDDDEAVIEFCRERGVKNILKYFPGGILQESYPSFMDNFDYGTGRFKNGRSYEEVTGEGETDMKARIIKETEKYLSETEEDESRYDRATELIRAMDGDIGNFAILIWNLVSTGIYEGIYEGNQKKLVRFLVRHTRRDKASLAEMEEVARTMAALDEKRLVIRQEGATDTYEHTSARLAELKAEEKAVRKQLKKLITRDLYEKRDETEEEEEYDEYSSGNEIVDAVGDGICKGIQVVTDVVCAPFEWLTDKMMGL
jgi:hypothetical protein